MLVHELLRDEGILLVRPQGSIQAGDFESIAKVVDPYIQEKGVIAKVAAVSDSTMMSVGPQIAKHVVKAQVRSFKADRRVSALAWLRE